MMRMMRTRLRWLRMGLVLASIALIMALAACGGPTSGRPAATATTVPPTATATPRPVTANVYYATLDQKLYALNPADGSVRWTFSRGGDIQLAVGRLVYVMSASSSDVTLYALDSTDGSVVWSAPGGARLMLANGALYFTAGSTVQCLDAATGKSRWQQALSIAPFVTVTDDTVYASTETITSQGTPGSSSLTALNTSDGTIRWTFTRSGEAIMSPMAANGVVYVESESPYFPNAAPTGRLYALNASDGTQRWSVEGAPAGANTFALSNGVFFAGGSATGISAYRTSDGKLLWKNSDPMFSYFTASGNAVYVKSWNNAAIALNATTGKQLWATSVAVTPPATFPLAGDGLLYSVGGRSSGKLAAITMGTGAIAWEQQKPQPLGFPATAGDAIYAYTLSESPTIYAFTASTGKPLWNHLAGNSVLEVFAVTDATSGS